MNYKESIQYLESYRKFGIRLGLSRMRHLLGLLGDPQKKFRSVHVAGTNGKGSVCAMTASVLKEAGYKTGLYTSPHLLDYTERIKINGRDIPRGRFASAVKKVKSVLDSGYSLKELPTEFELLTAAAFLYFAEKKTDIAVIETGLGGRLDSTNVVEPLVCAITNVELDHCRVLGSTVKKIAAEKAGIIKPGVPVVTACKNAEALNVVRAACKKNRCTLIRCAGSGAEIKVEPVSSSVRGQTVNMFSKGRTVKDIKIPFLGSHQALNAAVAAGVLFALQRFYAECSRSVSSSVLRKGFARARWPARFQVTGRRPLTVIDGAHNPSGIKELFKELAKFKTNKIFAVVGILKDKDYPGMIREICRHSGLVIAVSPESPRSCPAGLIASMSRKRGVPARTAGSPAEGLRLAMRLAGRCDAICVCGSLYTCAEVLQEA
jgi:dihydrofolate synthase / folylpolyglutamate synthase